MKYLLGQMVWRGDEYPHWEAPDVVNDRILDLRPLSAQAKAGVTEGHVLIATERDPLPAETLISERPYEILSHRVLDAVKDRLGIPESVTASTIHQLVDRLLGVYSDPAVGMICPPMIPNRHGNIRFALGDVDFGYECPVEGVQWGNILKVERENYRNARESGTHRKLLSVLRDKYRVDDYEVFIPRDLPKETPLQPTTTLRDNFDVGNHAELNGQASSDGWTWNKLEGHSTALFRTDTQAYAECTNTHVAGSNHCFYRAESDLSSVDHYVQGIMRTNSNAEVVCLVNRKDSSATLTHYYVNLEASGDRLAIYKRVAGTGTSLQNNSLTINTATNYTIRFAVNGSTLQTFNSGSQVGTNLTDTAISGGLRCGMLAFLASGLGPDSGGIEDFEASDGLTTGGGPLFRSSLANSPLTRGRLT
jgi:hypothetical protein